MNAQHEIETMEQLVEVATEANLNDLIQDLAEWLWIHVALKGQEVVEVGRVFKWNDDGQPGVRGVNLSVKPETQADQPAKKEG